MRIIALFIKAALAAGCAGGSQTESKNTMPFTNTDKQNFEQQIDGKQVSLYTLTNKNQMKTSITNYGGRIVSLIVPGKGGSPVDIVAGYEHLASYQKEGEPFFGALIGRYGNRIGKGKFTLGNSSYQLELNDGVNTLHGGKNGYYAKVWDAEQINDQSLRLRYYSADGEGGYPGNLDITVDYTLTDSNALEISYSAFTDKATVVNLTSHAYFNLNGEDSESVLDNVLTIYADAITPVDETLIPTGELQPVDGTPFDFREPTPIGKRINEENEQLARGKGYDHNFVLNKTAGLQLAATLYSPKTGIAMDIHTEEPGLQFYSGNFLTGDQNDGKGGKAYGFRSMLCLETQHFPNSPNEPSFPSTTLQPGEQYQTKTIYQFSVE